MSDPTPTCPVCQKPSVPDAPQGLCPECLIKTGFETRSGNEPAKRFVPPSIDEMAKLFPQLEIIAPLGQGGMGAVYKARQPRLDRFVALKILARERQDDPQFTERFEREARALAALTHPHIVTVYDFGEAGEHYYLLMEFVDGSNLRQLYRTGQFPPGRALAIIPQICDALQYAHECGVVHRDIKPENILLDKNGQVKIADFGLAKILDPNPKDLSLTEVDQVVGTPHYMAPEQLEKPLTVDCRADIYSVGVVFYEMLTGELPLGKFPPPSQKAHSDARLDHVVLQALEKDPAMRYQNVSEVKSAVESIASAPPKLTMPVKTPPIKTSPLQPGMSRTAKVVIAVSGVAFVLLAACVCVFVIGLIGTKPVAPSSINSKTYWDLLNEDQRAVVEHTENKFHSVLERRDFAGWSPQRLADLENASLQKIKNPPAPTSNPNDYFRAINTLAALRSVKAVPELLNIVSAHTDKLVWTEKANRDRCMATRALGLIGNKEGTVPQIIPLLYHPNISTRWWAQIALVQLTGQNFGGDWNAWAKWWNAQNLPPPIGSDLVRWWSGQEDPTKLMSMMTELNRTYFDGVSGQPESVSGTNTTTKPNNMSFTLEMQDTAKILHNPAETDIRSALASHKDDFGPVLVIKTDGTTDFIRVVAEQDGHFSFQHSPDGKIVFVSKKETFSVDEATKVAAGYAKGLPDWKNLVEWKELK